MRLLAGLLVAVPFLFGVLRLVTTGGADGRYLLVALAALVGAAVTVPRAGASGASRRARGVTAVVVSTISAAAAAVLLGGRSVPAVGIVSLAFGVCVGVGVILLRRSSPQERN